MPLVALCPKDTYQTDKPAQSGYQDKDKASDGKQQPPGVAIAKLVKVG